VLLGLTLYFDRSLGANLLYRFERAQYLELQKEHAAKKEERRGAGRKRGDGDAEAGEWKASDVYGAEHLLRLFGGYLSAVCARAPHTRSSQPAGHHRTHDDGCALCRLAQGAPRRLLGVSRLLLPARRHPARAHATFCCRYVAKEQSRLFTAYEAAPAARS
jgi:hypothetical protein